MTKKELLERIESFDDNAILIFSDDACDFLNVSSDGHSIENAIEVNDGHRKYIVLVE